MTNKSNSIPALAYFWICCSFLMLGTGANACNLSYVQLDSVIPVGNDYDIFVTLCIGGGIIGASTGADGGTGDFAFGFYSSCTNNIVLSSFTPSVTGDTTGVTNIGFNAGPAPQPPFGTQATILYTSNTINQLMCVSTTAGCGRPHQQCFPFVFRTDVIPDSIRMFGIEGSSNPVAGCYLDPDMVMDFAAYNPGGMCCSDVVAPNALCVTAASAYLDASGMATVSTTQVDNGSSDNCALGPITLSPNTFNCQMLGNQTVTLVVSDLSGNLDSCQATVIVEDTISPTIVCPNDTTVQSTGPGCGTNVFWTAPQGIDNCGSPFVMVSYVPGSYFPVGVRNVAYLAIDGSNNNGMCDFNVTVLAPPAITSAYNFSPIGNLSYTFSDQSSNGTISWQWDFGDGNTSTVQNPTHQYAASGNYTVCLIASDSCTADTTCQTLTVVGMESGIAGPAVQLYPNPGNGLLTLELNGHAQEPIQLRVLDPVGRTLVELPEIYTGVGGRSQVDLQGLTSGIYFLEIRGNSWSAAKRLLIQ